MKSKVIRVALDTAEDLARHGRPEKEQLAEDVRTAKRVEGLTVICCGRPGHPCGKVIKEGDPTRPASHTYCPECFEIVMRELDALEAAQTANEGEDKC